MKLRIIQNKIYEIRDQKVMLDFDLSELYGVQTKVLNQAVKRNLKRFPIDFMFQLNKTEWETMRSQFVTASKVNKSMQSQFVTASQKKRNVSVTPYAFTEQGIAMLSAILRSDKAINVSIAIMKAFVFLKQYALSHKDLTDKLKELESKYNKQFKDVYEAINYLMKKDTLQKQQSKRKQIGYKK